ncbi:uncharacterized protein DUF3180 [Haloactinopolyspora alba]|uniref:Uncharacterized protein DUF3180 n=1 Tax=Haloactinopolyspora alba TaxID=648780 RepID=A0A2P8DYY0_9ACTN|nr:DUF3180 domain-containing protein [Haloactinopolyspora alba]PSL02423.1 uncharacterized protein DUF3180 [Haloactinopolyspora alba]
MHKTTIASLVWAALVAVPIGWSIARVIDAWSGALPPVPWVLPFLLLFLGAGMFAGARAVRQWVGERRYDRSIDALRVARAAALAKATGYFGAVVVGAYAGIGALALTMLHSPQGRDRSVLSAIVVGCAVVLTVAAIRLERACLVPPSDSDENSNQD